MTAPDGITRHHAAPQPGARFFECVGRPFESGGARREKWGFVTRRGWPRVRMRVLAARSAAPERGRPRRTQCNLSIAMLSFVETLPQACLHFGAESAMAVGSQCVSPSAGPRPGA